MLGESKHLHTERAEWEITLDLTEYGTGTTCAKKIILTPPSQFQ
jgi:hypothetical protein